jgi:hypothetical protein
MARRLGAAEVQELADWAVGVQRKHVEVVGEASLRLAEQEAAA